MIPLLVFYMFLERNSIFTLQDVGDVRNDTTAWLKFGKLL